MTTIPTHAEGWEMTTRAMDADYSRSRGGNFPAIRAVAERTTNLGSGMMQIDYIDCPYHPRYFNMGV